MFVGVNYTDKSVAILLILIFTDTRRLVLAVSCVYGI